MCKYFCCVNNTIIVSYSKNKRVIKNPSQGIQPLALSVLEIIIVIIIFPTGVEV